MPDRGYTDSMMTSLTWERGPFEQCPRCHEQTFGFLSVDRDLMTLRCAKCRYSHGEELPAVDKAVIYLDQFMFSAIFKIKGGGPAPDGNQAFYDELIPLLRRVVLLQQAIFPHSNIHSSETIVFSDPHGLRDAYEDIGGDVSLRDSFDIEMDQVFAFAQAFRDGSDPLLTLNPDAVLEGSRNDWLPDMRISAHFEYSQLAKDLVRENKRKSNVLDEVVNSWKAEKPSFRVLLRREMQFGQRRRAALLACLQRMAFARVEGNDMGMYNFMLEPVYTEFCRLSEFLREGASDEVAIKRVGEFWDWPRLNEMPYHRISAYLVAAFGRRIAGRQRKYKDSLINDFQAIAAYAPYVDAMFIDRECAALLGEGDLRQQLCYRAKIYSHTNKDEFIAYLRELEARATAEVRSYAMRIYGIT